MQLNNPREQIIVTPEIDQKKTEVTVRKNKVIMRFNQALKDSTTYTINFRESVQDITERNAATNLRLAFSTGPIIDTLRVRGSIFRLLNDETEPNCLVALAPATDTFDIFRHKPEYFTLTDKQGNYALENLKAGSYLIYAFQDVNRNLIVDSKSEMFGYRIKPLLLDQENKTIDLPLLRLDMRPLKLASARPLGNQFIIRLNKGLLNKTIHAPDTIGKLFYDEPENGVIRIYNTFNHSDSIALHCHFADSAGNKIDTVLYAKFLQKGLRSEKFNATIEQATYYNMKVNITVVFNKPIYMVNSDSSFIPIDSLTTIRLKQEDFIFNENRTKCELTIQLTKPLNFDIKTGTTITPVSRTERLKSLNNPTNSRKLYNYIVFEKGTFISAEKDTMSTLTSRITEIKPEEKATLLYEVQTDHQAITELYQKDKKVALSEQKKGKFTLINPVNIVCGVI